MSAHGNPNHPVTRSVQDHWHKIAALIMIKFGVTELVITKEDVDKLVEGNRNIVFDARGEAYDRPITLRIVDDATAEKLAKEHGGRAADS